MTEIKFLTGDIVQCINDQPLEGNSIAPPLKLGDLYTIKGMSLDSKGNQHYNIGLVSKYNYIRSYETSEELPEGDKIHWCHPSRFKLHSRLTKDELTR